MLDSNCHQPCRRQPARMLAHPCACHHNRVKIRKTEISAIFNDLQERTNMKIIDYIEDIEKKENSPRKVEK
jgi:hypothetical protein